MSKGIKHDQGKADLSLIPKVALEKCAEAFMVGARKYSRYNFCAGLESSRQVGAAMRHLAAWFDGEENDPVDKQHHLGAAMACCAMILREMELGTLIDDRYKQGTAETQHPPAPEPEPVLDIDVYDEFGTPFIDPENDYPYRVVCRRPDGVELTSLCSWESIHGAARAADEYTKQYPMCTFLASEVRGD